MRTTCAAALLLTMATAAHASWVAVGVGVGTCAQFAREYKNDPGGTELLYLSWAAGYLSGMNLIIDTLKRRTTDLEAMPMQSKIQFMRDYCDAHPLMLYSDGVLELMSALPLVPVEAQK